MRFCIEIGGKKRGRDEKKRKKEGAVEGGKDMERLVFS